MLEINVDKFELFDENTEEFVSGGPYKLRLEHSLISVSKWESKYNKPFLSNKEKTTEELMAYVKYMTITQGIPDVAYYGLTKENISEINDYISAKMTATWFSDRPGTGRSREIITSELIYYWMITLGIPFECQKWHLNRLLTLIRVCSIKSAPSKKMPFKDLARRNSDINAARRKMLGNRG